MSKAPSNPLKVFLCHCYEDKPTVSKIHYHLKKTGCDSWLDAGKLLGGQDWELEIQKEIRNADVFIIFLSKNSIGKEGFIQKEIRAALAIEEEKPEGVIFIIPVLLDECGVPPRLTRWHYLNFNQEGFWRKLIDSLNARAVQTGKNLLEFSNTPSVHDHLPKAKPKPLPEKPHEQHKNKPLKGNLINILNPIGLRLVGVLCGGAATATLWFASDDYYRPGDTSTLGIVADYIVHSGFTLILLALIAVIGGGFFVHYIDRPYFQKNEMPTWLQYFFSVFVGYLGGILIDATAILVVLFIIGIIVPLLIIAVVLIGIGIYLWVSYLNSQTGNWPSSPADKTNQNNKSSELSKTGLFDSASKFKHKNTSNAQTGGRKNSFLNNNACWFCKGSGKQKCTLCGGTGNTQIKGKDCLLCHGSGELDCFVCNGTGEK